MNELIALCVLLFLSGLFSGSETALVALSMGRAEALLKERRRGAQALYRLKSDPSKMLITILIGNNVVNIGASALTTVIATRWFGSMGPGIAVGVLTVVILIFGEITPKSLATRYAERISLAIAPLMVLFMRLLMPFVWAFGHLTTWVNKRIGSDGDPTVTESEIISLVGHGEEEGTIESKEREMIERVFAFNDLKVKDVMTPRGQIFSLSGARTIDDALPEVMHASYSRIPIYEKRPDDIRKILYLRDILEAAVSGKTDVTLNEIAHDSLYVPQNQRIDRLFATLSRRKRHLAVVVDELGALEGIVTLEDLLEELMGEIYDESDIKLDEIQELETGKISVEGIVELRIIENYFGMSLSGKPTDTVSLWILNHTERIPRTDEQFAINGLKVFVDDASRRRIHKVILSR